MDRLHRPGITRRSGAALILAGAGLSCLPRAARSALIGDGTASLDLAARGRGLRFGSAMGIGKPGTAQGGFQDPAYRALMAAQCGVMTPEAELKWTAIRRTGPKDFDFSGADRLLAFAEANAMAFRGHNLLWVRPAYIPAWVSSYDFGPSPRLASERLIRDHIAAVCGRYGARITSYDVVNEAIDEKTGAMRESPYSRYISPQEVVDIAFRAAREAAPHAQLVYNDFMGWEPGQEKHREGVLHLLRGFRARSVPVDALGIQSHIGDPPDKRTPFGAHDAGAWRAFLDRVTGMGYDLLVTEFDVSGKRLPAEIAVRDRAMAEYARTYLDMLVAYPALGDVVCWGLEDRYSWLRRLTPRADGALKRPTPYDDQLQPKPLRAAIAAALLYAPSRAPDLGGALAGRSSAGRHS